MNPGLRSPDHEAATNVEDAWTSYWQAGSTESCFAGSEAAVELACFWAALGDELADGTRVLDLATGNGAVARSLAANARSRGVRLQIDAVDAARIDPPAQVSDPEGLLRTIRFHGSTELEALPFADHTFDAVVSQFGFEYADEPAAAGEAARVLADGGRIRLILHARAGAVERDIATRLERLRWVLDEEGAVALVLALVRAAAARDAGALRKLSARLPAAAAQVRRLAQNPPPGDAALFYATEFLRAWARRGYCRFTDLRHSVEDGWRNANGVAARQAQMQRAARSAADVARIAARFATSGLEVGEAKPILDQQGRVQIAWLLDASRT